MESTHEPCLPEVPATVSILTYKRPETLRHALEAVAVQISTVATPIEILVVDNDPSATAQAIVDSIDTAVPLRYVSEPKPGIAAARNAALSASRDSRLLIFFDDDETPSPDWLNSILAHWQMARCAAVAGPVLSILPESIPNSWVVASGIFERQRFPSGTPRPGAGAGNLLLDLEFVRLHGLQFDTSLGLQGGEDTMLTHEIVARGGIIEWCDEAVAFEPVDPDRITHSWMRRRSIRAGTSWSRARLRVANSRRQTITTYATVAVRSSVQIARGLVMAGTGLLLGREAQSARGLRSAYSHMGAIAGLFGGQVSDYSRD